MSLDQKALEAARRVNYGHTRGNLLEQEIEAYLAALPPPTVAVGEVRALEWETLFDSGSWRAKKPFGSSYYIEQRDDLRFDWNGQLFDELADAKAAAQADYEARIRSALVPPPPGEPTTPSPKLADVAMAMAKDLADLFSAKDRPDLVTKAATFIYRCATSGGLAWEGDGTLALSAQPTAGWLDMATAPKDGTHVLVAQPGAKPVRAFFDGRWIAHGFERTPALSLDGKWAPTHWQPLPPPPPTNAGGKL